MKKGDVKRVSRREFLRRTGGLTFGIASTGPFFLFPERTQAQRKTLKILRWRHFVPAHDEWFDGAFAKQWGQRHETEVIVHYVPIEKIHARAASEVRARKGHDLVLFPSPPARYERFVIDHREVYRAVFPRQGQMIRLAHRSTYNPRTKKYFAFADSYVVAPFLYRRDHWAEIGYSFGPTTYDGLRRGARQIRERLGIPCGLGLAPNLDSNVWLHGLLWSFGASVQDAEGHPILHSRQTIEALKYVKALYQESGTPEVFRWRRDSNDRALLRGRVSCTVDAISLIRQAERLSDTSARHILPNPTLRGPEAWLICPHITSCYAIWTFAENPEGAKQFLVDLTDQLRVVFKVSAYCHFPCFPKTVPKLKIHLENDPRAEPHHKYATLEDALVWTRNIGYPGYATAAIDEVFNAFIVPRMFAAVAKGRRSPEEAAAMAEKRVRRIFEKWNNR